MTAAPMENSPQDEPSRPGGVWRRAAGYTALAAGSLVLVVALVLATDARQTLHRTWPIDLRPLDAPELTRLRQQLRQSPGNEALTQEIRAADERVRRDYFRRIDRAERGTYLLLAGAAAAVISLRLAAQGRRGWLPQGPAPGLKQWRRGLHWGRLAVTVLAAAAGGAAALTLLSKPPAEVPAAEKAGPEERAAAKAAGDQQQRRSFAAVEEMRRNWPRFRGFGGLGVSAYPHAPTNWDGASGRGILWKAEAPLPGQNSPIVWDDKVLLSGATQTQREVYCYSAQTGEMLWRRAVSGIRHEGEPYEAPEDTGYAASTMATDGVRAYAIFANGDVAGFDWAGKQLWGRNLGTPDSVYGYATSLTTYQDRVLIQLDQGDAEAGKSALLALDGATGRTVWRTPRPVGSSWTTPVIVYPDEAGGPAAGQLVTASDPLVIAYDPEQGRELWRLDCLGADVAPSPVYAGGLVFALQPYNKIFAIRPGTSDGSRAAAIAWTGNERIPDVCSPVSNGELIWLLDSGGGVICYAVANGQQVWKADLEGEFAASPGIAGDRLYATNKEGVTYLMAAGREFRALGQAALGESGVTASPAFGDGRLYLRAKKNLYGIGESGTPSP